MTLCQIWKLELDELDIIEIVVSGKDFIPSFIMSEHKILKLIFLVGKFLYSTFINAHCIRTQVSNIFYNETVSKVHTNFNSTVIQARISESCFVQFNFKDYFLMSALHYHKTYSANLSCFNTMIMNVWKILVELIQFFLSV